MKEEREFYERLSERGVSRRDFMKYCGMLTATMGLSSSFIPKVAEVFAAPKQRPPVVWLHFAECTGCSEAILRSMYPWIDQLVLEILSIEYHETIFAAAGHQMEDNLQAAVKKYNGKFICVVEGAIATKYDGAYGKIGGRTFLEIAKDVVPKALAVICLGTCAAFGGVQAAKPIRAVIRGWVTPWVLKRSIYPVVLPIPSTLSAQWSTISSWANFRPLTNWEGRSLPMERPSMINVPEGPTMKTMNS